MRMWGASSRSSVQSWDGAKSDLLPRSALHQLNKYENGVNRISAGRLHRFARLLGIPIQRFVEDTPASKTSGLPVAAGVGRDLVRMLGTDEGARLRLAFARLRREHQRAVVALVKQIASSTRRR
jgi:transcriptional regulator with XRE-family HTH domain